MRVKRDDGYARDMNIRYRARETRGLNTQQEDFAIEGCGDGSGFFGPQCRITRCD
jgi:hypothetical protein